MNEVTKSIRYPKRLFAFFCVILSFFAMITCIKDIDRPAQFAMLWILPFGHLLISFILYWFILKGTVIADFPILIISALLTLRNAFTPMVMAFDTYGSKVGIAPTGEDVMLAVWVYLYETLVITLYIFCRRDRSFGKKRIVIKKPANFQTKQIFLLALSLGIILSLLSFIALPEVRTKYYTIFASNFTDISSVNIEREIGIKRALSSASDYIITGTRLSFCAYLIFKLRGKGETLLNYLSSLFIIIAQFLLMNDSNALIIMLVLALLFLLCKLFPRYSEKTMKYVIIIALVFAILFYNHRIVFGAYRHSLSLWLQAYLPGVNNFACATNLLDMPVSERVNRFFVDIYATIPFRTTLFGYEGGQVTSSLLWSSNMGIMNQIMPNTFQSYYYFGFILSPFFSVLSVKWALDLNEKMKHENNPCMYVVEAYLMLYLSIVPVMYNFAIFLKMFLSRALFMCFFAIFCPADKKLNCLSAEGN